MTSWVPKAAAPATFNLGQAFAAAITGDPTWGWLTGWIPILGDITVETAPFCAAGPLVDNPALSLDDFAITDRNGLLALAKRAALALKLRDAAYDFVFAAYCELPGEGTGCEVAFTHSYGAGGGKTEWTVIATDPLEVPAAATTVNFSRTGGDCNLDAYWGTIPSSPFDHFIAGGGIYTGWPPGQTFSVNRSQPCNYLYIAGEGAAPGTLTVRFCGPGLGAETWDPTPQPKPVGLPDPVTRVYSTIADLGAELDRQEFKLEHVLNMLQWVASTTASPQLIEDLPEDVGEAVIAAEGAAGFVVRLFNVPAGVSEDFPTPGRLHRAGWAHLTSPHGYLPPIELSQREMVIAPIPPWTNGLLVNVYPPTTATVARLRPTK